VNRTESETTAPAGSGDAPPEGTDADGPSLTPEDQPSVAERGSVVHADRVLEVAAVILLGVGTLLAAWSGYQSSIWNGIQAGDYVRGSGERVESTRASTLAGQERLYDSQVFSQWLNAYDVGNAKLAAIYERRFREEFRVAFQAWLKTDPFNSPSAPPGPLFMAEYVQASALAADAHSAKADAFIKAGEDANDDSDHYVLFTVIFATVLFLAAVTDRFRWRPTRIAVLLIGVALAVFGLIGLLQLPIG
jgi:hypothetical protein